MNRLALAFILVMALRLSAVAQPMVEVPLVWDDNQEGIAYYAVYVSNSQSQFGEQPYRRVTKLPTDNSPLILRFPADGITRYVVVTAINDQGESAYSNEIWVTPVCENGDVQQ